MSYLLNVFAIAKIVFYPSWSVNIYLIGLSFLRTKRKLLESPDLEIFQSLFSVQFCDARKVRK